MAKASPSRILNAIWRRTGHRWIRRVELQIMSRPLSEPNLPIPKGKDSPMHEGDGFFMDLANHEMIEQLKGQFPPAKLRIFHDMVDHPDIDFVMRIKPDGECWGYLMHGLMPMVDVEFRFTIPIKPGQEALQFDGWVNPKYRGRLIGIIGSNWALDRRRASGHESLIVAVRSKDRVALKYHNRFGYQTIGKIIHYRIGKLRWNKMQIEGRD